LGLQVSFDPAVLTVLDVAEGDLLKQGDPSSSFEKTIDQNAGRITLDLASQSSVTARSGTVTSITFEVTSASAESLIDIGSILPAGADGEAIAFVPPQSYKLALTK
ncbi:MAG: cohesin domain-containing protein, partial [Propionivibrio sp.]